MKWETKPLDSLCDEITVGFVGTMATYYSDEGVLFLRSQNIEPFKLNLEPSQMKFITPEFHSKLRKSALKEGDIAIVRTGYPGTACVIPSDLGEANCADLVIARPHKGVDSKFVCYFINSPLAMAMIGGSLVGSAQKHFNVGVAKRLEIPCPPLPTQQKIASILSAYDDLIENNLKRIRLLEEAAQHLFREWFVRFRFPGWEEVEVVDGLPVGWERKKLSDIYVTSSGGTPSRTNLEFYIGEVNWFKSKELMDCPLIESEEKISETAVQQSSAKLFPVNTVLLAMYGATIGKLGILTIPATSNQACCGIISKDKDFNHLYLYQWLLFNKEHILSFRMGAAQENISQSVIRDLEMVAPERKMVQKFNQFSELTFQHIVNLTKQNQKLKEARDILLPRLMNQTIEV